MSHELDDNELRARFPTCERCGRDATHPGVFVVRVVRLSGGMARQMCNKCDEARRRRLVKKKP